MPKPKDEQKQFSPIDDFQLFYFSLALKEDEINVGEVAVLLNKEIQVARSSTEPSTSEYLEILLSAKNGWQKNMRLFALQWLFANADAYTRGGLFEKATVLYECADAIVQDRIVGKGLGEVREKFIEIARRNIARGDLATRLTNDVVLQALLYDQARFGGRTMKPIEIQSIFMDYLEKKSQMDDYLRDQAPTDFSLTDLPDLFAQPSVFSMSDVDNIVQAKMDARSKSLIPQQELPEVSESAEPFQHMEGTRFKTWFEAISLLFDALQTGNDQEAQHWEAIITSLVNESFFTDEIEKKTMSEKYDQVINYCHGLAQFEEAIQAGTDSVEWRQATQWSKLSFRFFEQLLREHKRKTLGNK